MYVQSRLHEEMINEPDSHQTEIPMDGYTTGYFISLIPHGHKAPFHSFQEVNVNWLYGFQDKKFEDSKLLKQWLKKTLYIIHKYI